VLAVSTDQAEAFASWGRSIAIRRRELGLTQRQLGDRIGVDVITISRAERGVGGFGTYMKAAVDLDLDLLPVEAKP
jgi:transcriptional regulator with XRE-family HTH domain